MANEAKEIRDELKEAITTRKAERDAVHRRAEILHLAGQIVNGMMSTTIAEKAPIEGLAGVAVQLAAHIVAATDRALSPIVQLDATKIAPGGGVR